MILKRSAILKSLLLRLFIICFLNCKYLMNRHKISLVSDNPKKKINWKEWLTKRMFYQYGIVYMCTRLCYNISQNLLAFFLIFTLEVQEPSKNSQLSLYLAIFPLIIYLSSCIGSFSCEKLFQKFGRKKTFAFGTFNLLISAIVMTVTKLILFHFICFKIVFNTKYLLCILFYCNSIWSRAIS